MNSICVIKPYRYEGIWVFDDESTGLDKEAFVSGADVIIDLMTEHIPNAHDGFVMIFSGNPFPSHEHHLTWQREEDGGNWYLHEEFGQEGWLCPALFLYFENAPKDIYVKVESIDEAS
jgi:hypothetical protein